MNDNIKTTTPSVTASITENRIIAPIALGVAILIAILVTRPLYLSYIESRATETKTVAQHEALTAEYEKLLAIKANQSGSGSSALSERIEKISKKFTRSDIMSTVMLSDKFTKESIDTVAPISIASVTLSDPSKLPNGLSLTKVGVSLRGRTVDNIIDYITYLTNDTPYAFTIEDISLPIDTAPEGDIPSGYSLSLSLGVYSYE